MSLRKKISALLVVLFLGCAVFYVESSHASRIRSSSSAVWSVSYRSYERNGAPLGEHNALKKTPLVERETALSEPVQTPSRNLAPKEQRVETDSRNFRVLSVRRLILAPKISTNLFLSVLNL